MPDKINGDIGAYPTETVSYFCHLYRRCGPAIRAAQQAVTPRDGTSTPSSPASDPQYSFTLLFTQTHNPESI